MSDRSEQPIYLDYNATTPHAPEVIAAMRPFLDQHFGNPSSAHRYGAATRAAIARARSQVANLLNSKPDEVVFTSGGTESNNYAIRGVALACAERGRHIISSQIEHPAVTEVCRRLEAEGFEVTWLPVDGDGLVRVSDVEAAIRPDTVLITLMHANNEVGAIQPIQAVAEMARRRGILVHTDAAQSAGKISIDVNELGVDLLSIAGHKVYAPKGIGALYIRNGTALHPLMFGAGQEAGRRPGTENVLEIVGLGEACEVAERDLAQNAESMRVARDELERGLRESIPDVRVNGHPE
jgi:cysteine desulfurase